MIRELDNIHNFSHIEQQTLQNSNLLEKGKKCEFCKSHALSGGTSWAAVWEGGFYTERNILTEFKIQG